MRALTGTRDRDRPAQHCGKRFLKHLLDAYGIRLPLPPVEGRPAIGKMHEITLHGVSPFQDRYIRTARSGNCSGIHDPLQA